MHYAIKHQLHIKALKSEVFKAISTIKGLSNWWTVQTQGTEGLGAEIDFAFGEFQGPIMKVIEYKEDNSLVWRCIARAEGWIGHTFTFKLSQSEGKTLVQFSHDGWPEQDEFYAQCSFSWGRYLESLRQYCQTRKGEAFGSPNYR